MTRTPGPWTAWDDDGTGTLPCVLAKQPTTYGNFYVAQCNVYDDAHLIAEAPSLLTVAKLAADLMERQLNDDGSWIDAPASYKRELLETARLAIQKAGG